MTAATLTHRQHAASTSAVLSADGSPWWRDAVVYQIFVASFADSDGDGIGDLAGVTSRLGYLAELGVDAIWLTPHYPSPMADGGYDIADHTGVHPDFGTLADYDALVEAAHARGLRVMIDIVPNHVSEAHPWFQDALAGVAGAAERFHFRPAEPGGPPPNNWQSLFGGPAWTHVPALGQSYLHLFSPAQPDLNWDHPDVAAEFERVLRFWLDRGTDGIRVDVAAGLVKDPGLRDNPGSYTPGLFGHGPEQAHTWDQPGVHAIYRSWRRLLDSYRHEPASVGEVCLSDLAASAAYCRSDELGSAFTIELLKTTWGARQFAHAIAGPLAAFGAVGARPAWVLSNHDKSRMASRFGTGPTGPDRARCAAMLLLALPGQAYLYAGDELGLPDAHIPEQHRRDPIFFRTGGARAGRDGVRVPMPWDSEAANLGFSAGPGPLYLPQPADEWVRYSANLQARYRDSFLGLHRNLLALRRQLGVFGRAERARVSLDGDVLTVTLSRGRDRARVVLNMGEQPALVPAGRVLACSHPGMDLDGPSLTLAPDRALWLADRPGRDRAATSRR